MVLHQKPPKADKREVLIIGMGLGLFVIEPGGDENGVTLLTSNSDPYSIRAVGLITLSCRRLEPRHVPPHLFSAASMNSCPLLGLGFRVSITPIIEYLAASTL